MPTEILPVIWLPFLGTVLGAAGVYFLRDNPGKIMHHALTGFAAGVMTAASVWSLLIPAMEQAAYLGKFAFLPATLGVWAGVGLLILLHRIRLPAAGERSSMLIFAVALHNLPEGMAVGVVAAGWLAGIESISAPEALALSLGIALQNLPEGAVVSMPLKQAGMGRHRAFGLGVASGAIEPLGAAVTLCLAPVVVPVLPYLLGFAAGAMLYVVVEEMLPQLGEGRWGTVFFTLGFTLMMVLDVALG